MGHSQAATTLFILLSERPEYNEKIAIAHAMTPPIVFKNNGPLLHSIAQHTREIEVETQAFPIFRNQNVQSHDFVSHFMTSRLG